MATIRHTLRQQPATAGGIGIIIPPSIPMVIYGVTGQVSISRCSWRLHSRLSNSIFALRTAFPQVPQAWSWRRKVVSQASSAHCKRMAFGPFLAPLIILGGIYAGLFHADRSGHRGYFLYAFRRYFRIHRELKFKAFMSSLNTTSWLTGRISLCWFYCHSLRLSADGLSHSR